MQTIQAIETKYKGYRFRSRLEARYAVALDELGMPWSYEQQGFDLGDDGKYLPDFWLPTIDAFMEVKPRVEWEPMRVYLAGSFDTGWRDGLELYGHHGEHPERPQKKMP